MFGRLKMCIADKQQRAFEALKQTNKKPPAMLLLLQQLTKSNVIYPHAGASR